MTGNKRTDGNTARLEHIDAFVDEEIGHDTSPARMAKLMEKVRLELTQARTALDRAAGRARLMRAAARCDDAESRDAAIRMAADLAKDDVINKRRPVCCANEDVANIYAAVPRTKMAATASRLLLEAIENDLDVDANSILCPLDDSAIAKTIADIEKYAGKTRDHFKRYRANMILFGIFNQNQPADGGVRLIKCAIEPDANRAQTAFARAQEARTGGISVLVDSALRENRIQTASGIGDYRIKIPETLRSRILTIRTGVGVELDNCVGGDRLIIARDIGAQILHVSLLLRDSETGEYDFPVSVTIRRIDEPLLRLRSLDKNTGAVSVTSAGELFDFSAVGKNEWVRMSKAATIAAGVIPYSCRAEPPDSSLAPYFDKLGGGLEIVTQIKGIPVGSGLGTSSALAAAIVMALVKFTGQAASQPDSITDEEKMLVVGRVLLAESMVGTNSGWQDPCAIFPGVKILDIAPGEFLPHLRPVRINVDVRSRLNRTMKLTDFAYHPAHTAEWEFSGLWAMRLSAAYEARMQSRKLIRDQIANIENGRVSAMGGIISENWKNRRVVSPKTASPYIERVIELVRSVPGLESAGFDSCGAHGSAGGCWWSDSPLFPRIFANKVLEAAGEFKGRIKLDGKPRVYDHKINEKGIVLELI